MASGHMQTASRSALASVFPDDWTPEDASQLENAHLFGAWQPRPPGSTGPGWVKYWPEWTDPAWVPGDTEYSFDGEWQRPARPGRPKNALRPAIHAVDRIWRPTKYAMRFGIHPHRTTNAARESRSKMTPQGASFPPTGDWSEDESFQSFVLNGFTSQELVDAGALEPDRPLDEPDLTGGIHELFQRHRWTQEEIPYDSPIYGIIQGDIRTTCKYRFNGGQEGFYDVSNQRVWDALVPALQLATRVLDAGPPHWRAVLAFTQTLRQVPRHVDGRSTDAAGKDDDDDNYRPYASVWLPGAAPTDWDEYDAASLLNAMGFDSGRATYALLRRDMKLSIVCNDTHTSGLAAPYRDAATGKVVYRICVTADMIWPLLLDTYTPSEKAAYHLVVAKVILHELIHCCRYAHNEMMFFPKDLQAMADRDFVLTDAMCGLLTVLKGDIHGPGDDLLEKSIAQYFFQDEPQLEEGKSFDNQLWGGDISQFPYCEQGLFYPMVQLTRWPWAHGAVHLQNKCSVDAGLYAAHAGPDAYRTFLVHPAAPAYNLRHVVPVAAYGGLLRQAWWRSEFQRYGLAGLKLTNDLAGRAGRVPATALDHASYYATTKSLLQAAYPSDDDAVKIFMEKADAALTARGHGILATYLSGLVMEAIMPEVEDKRLEFESRTWARTYDQEIGGLATKTLKDLQAMNLVLQDLASTPSADRPHVKLDKLNTSLEQLLQTDLLDLHRRIVYHAVQYAQTVLGIYFIQPPDRRGPVRIHVVKLRDYLSRVRNNLGQVHAAIAGWRPVLSRDTSGQPLGLDDAFQVLRRLAEQDPLLRDAPDPSGSSYPTPRSAVLASVARLETLLPAVRDFTAGHHPLLQSDLAHLDALLRLSSPASLDDPAPAPASSSSAPASELRALSRARRTIGRPRTLRRAALRQLHAIGRNNKNNNNNRRGGGAAANDAARVMRMVRVWVGILSLQQRRRGGPLAPELRDAQRTVVVAELLLTLRAQRTAGDGRRAAAGRAAEAKLRDRVRELMRREPAARDRMREEYKSEELAEMGIRL